MKTFAKSIRVGCFLLCDYARIDGGKLYILGGGWDRLQPNVLPFDHVFVVALKMVIPIALIPQSIELDLLVSKDAAETVDSTQISRNPLRLEFPQTDLEGKKYGEVTAIVNMAVEIRESGRYFVSLNYKQEEIALASFTVQIEGSADIPSSYEPLPIPSSNKQAEGKLPN